MLNKEKALFIVLMVCLAFSIRCTHANASETASSVNSFDFVTDSITEKVAYNSKSTKFSEYGKKLYKSVGYNSYKEAMEFKWSNVFVNGKPSKLNVDLETPMTFKDYEKTLKSFAKHDGVYLYKIGNTVNGLPMYALELDMTGEGVFTSDVMCLTGSIHAREQAGYMYILKQLSELINGWESGGKEAIKLLKQYRIAAVPCCNPDVVFDMVSKGTKKWTDKNGQIWKANMNGVDLNRNFPSFMSGYLLKGNTKHYTCYTKPAYGMYPGVLGAEPETRALMKWTYWYVAHEQATIFIGYHQQGRVVYAGQPEQGSMMLKDTDKYRDSMDSLLGYKSIGLSKKTTLKEIKEQYDGTGDGLNGFAVSCALGKYNPEIGNFVWWDGSKSYSSMQFLTLDSADSNIPNLEISNPQLRVFTVEFGNGNTYIGGSKEVYKRNALEYKNKNISKLLYIFMK